MPRFDPPLPVGVRIAATRLIDAAFDVAAVDEARLTRSSRLLLRRFRALRETGKSRDAILAQAMRDQSKVHPTFAERVRAVFTTFDLTTARVLCLTTDPLNEVMWGHYADSYRGCVLGFTHIRELDTPLLAAQAVAYTERAPSVGSTVDFVLYGGTEDMREKIYDAVCFAKKAKWSYEQEWRVVTWGSSEASSSQFEDCRFYPRELASITFGSKMSDDDETKVRQLLASTYSHVVTNRLTVVNGELAINRSA